MVHFPRLRNYFATRFHHMNRFFRDSAEGKLPRYAFVEPRLMFNHNDMHPPVRIAGKSFHSSVLAGDALIHEVYDAVRRSESPKGNNWQNTLLMITFDEHGGCYDHVPPPVAVPPHPERPVGQMGFRFDRLGVRIPTILISAYVEPGTVISTQLDHGSFIKTLSEKWDLGHLTERDRAARSIAEAFSRETPRPREQWPVTKPAALPDADAAPPNEHHPLNDLQRTALGLTAALAGHSEGLTAEVRTVGHAVRFMRDRISSLKSHS
jgi:phospholipase C